MRHCAYGASLSYTEHQPHQHLRGQGYVQPRKNGAKRLLNGNGGALNTLFWWRKCCNYGSWEGHSLCSFWRIVRAWWNRYKYVFNTAKYAQCYSHCPCVQNNREHPNEWRDFWKLWFLIIVIQYLPRISGWKDKHFRWRIIHFLPPRLCYDLYDLIIFIVSIRLIIADHCCCAIIL